MLAAHPSDGAQRIRGNAGPRGSGQARSRLPAGQRVLAAGTGGWYRGDTIVWSQLQATRCGTVRSTGLGRWTGARCLQEPPACRASVGARGPPRRSPQTAVHLLEEVHRNVHVEKPGMAFEESVSFYGTVLLSLAVWGPPGRPGDRPCPVFLRVMGEGQKAHVWQAAQGAAECLPQTPVARQALQAGKVAGRGPGPFPDTLSFWFPERTFRGQEARSAQAPLPLGKPSQGLHGGTPRPALWVRKPGQARAPPGGQEPAAGGPSEGAAATWGCRRAGFTLGIFNDVVVSGHPSPPQLSSPCDPDCGLN
ncbi:uncharacterized protein LOC124230372 isoform X1 [Equus quagga]|uniref:uncharacterized protein LOC124230372 isoform X1 n=1 Tax=Equus quagga TaxID=89248 RepID=UPI001EE1B74E|nr:uncharacterized protein LOC124230372 isoform X1 [Equus quagga]XP_046502323.1 uncharacterized protein LOC124230372 isoform X1 [Equus quagga]XP_046502324.1 uncharacterized protein LOC124230372 isoform X1 [Equus quagga]